MVIIGKDRKGSHSKLCLKLWENSKAGGAASKVEMSTFQNKDYFEKISKLLKYVIYFDDLCVRYW